MEILYECCCGLDVHKKSVVACLIQPDAAGQPSKVIRTFGTMTADLLALADWLTAAGCTHVAMESSGVYWKPVYNLLEGHFELLVVNAQHIKAGQGARRTSETPNGLLTCYATACCIPSATRPDTAS